MQDDVTLIGREAGGVAVAGSAGGGACVLVVRRRSPRPGLHAARLAQPEVERVPVLGAVSTFGASFVLLGGYWLESRLRKRGILPPDA